MTAQRVKDALFCFATRGFNFATRKTNQDTPACEMTEFAYFLS